MLYMSNCPDVQASVLALLDAAGPMCLRMAPDDRQDSSKWLSIGVLRAPFMMRCYRGLQTAHGHLYLSCG